MAALCMARKCTRFPVSPRKDDFSEPQTLRYHSLWSVQGTTHCAYFCACRCVTEHLSYIGHTHLLLHYWTSPSSVLFVCLSQIQKDHFFVRLFFFTFTSHATAIQLAG